MIRQFLLLALLAAPLLLPPLSACCVWDRDTLASEAAGAPDLTLLIAGKVDRFPKKYYEMREKLLTDVPQSGLLALDDLMNCIVRTRSLRKYDNSWLVKLDHALDEKERIRSYFIETTKINSEDAKLDRRRSDIFKWFANVLYVLDELNSEGARAPITIETPLTLAVRHLELSDKREPLNDGNKCLLLFAQWLLRAESAGDTLLPDFLGLKLANKTALEPNSQLKDRGLEDCIEGLAGLIRAAPEFENVDVFYALSLALAVNGQQSLAHMARLRAFEIIDAGGKSLVPGAPTGEALKLAITPRKPEHDRMVDTIPLSKEMRASIEADYKKLRARVIARERDRMEFITAGLNKGEHPDTHPDFWKGWTEPELALPAAPANPPTFKEQLPVAGDPPAPNKEVIYGGIPVPNTPESGRVGIGGLQVHWIGLVIAGVLVVSLGLVLTLATMRKRGHDEPSA